MIAKSKNWDIDGSSYKGLFLNLDEDMSVTIQVQKDEKLTNKQRKEERTTSSGSTVKASLVKRDKKKITLNRAKDNFTMVLKTGSE